MKTKTIKKQNPFIRALSMLLAIMILFSSGHFSNTASAASSSRSSIANGTYSIRLHDDSTKCMNTIFASTAEDKAEIGVDPFNSENNELWIITHRGSNYYTISPKHASNLCLNALLANKTPGDLVTLHRYTANDAASLWSFHANSDGSYTIKNKATGLVLDVKDGNYAIGNRFIHWKSNNYLRAQAFYLKKVSTTSTNTTIVSNNRAYISNGTYSIRLYSNTLRCMNVQYASTAEDRARIVVDTYNGESNEQFILINRGSNYYTISPKHASNLCLNALLANKARGDVVTLHRYEAGDAASLWSFHLARNGYYYIKNKATGLVIHTNSTSIGSPCINWTQNTNVSSQGFRLSKISSSTSGTVVSSNKWEFPMDNAYCTWTNKANMSWSNYTDRSGSRDYHIGIDIYGTNGTVKAAANGKVVALSTSAKGANGRYIIIKHTISGKTVYSFYAHLSSVNVSLNQTVSVGTKIGVAGGSGYGRNNYYKTHLHFAIVDTLWSSGGYYGYATYFKGNSVRYSNVTYYNPVYVINNDRLP